MSGTVLDSRHISNSFFTFLKQSCIISELKCKLIIKCALHIYTMEYYNGILQRNEIELFVVRWMDLEPVIQSEVSQKKKTNTVC